MSKETKIKKQQIEINSKHIAPRVAIFVVAVCIALGGFGVGIYTLTNRNAPKEGWNNYKLKNYVDASYSGYEENVYLNYYLSGDNVKSLNKKVLDKFVTSSKEIYALIDPSLSHKYKDINNIGTINANINEKVEINEELFNILSDAKEKTYKEGSTYSVFSGLINDYWKYFISNVNLSSYKEPEYLDLYVDYAKDLSNYNLSLENINDKYYATLSLSNELTEFIKESKLEDVSILDLNSLFYSYYLDALYSRFKEDNLIKGYIYTHTGEMVFMNSSFADYNGIKIYDATLYNNSFACGEVNTNKCSFVSSIRIFPVFNEYESEYFMTTIPGNKLSSRSLFYDYRVGYSKQEIKASTLINENMSSSLVDVTFNNLNIINNEDISLYSLLSNDYIAYGLVKDKEKTLYVHNDKNYYKDTLVNDGSIVTYQRITI